MEAAKAQSWAVEPKEKTVIASLYAYIIILICINKLMSSLNKLLILAWQYINPVRQVGKSEQRLR
jgi:hypothetical protein